MIDIDGWRKRSPVSAWAAFITLIVSSGYVVLKAVIELKDRFAAPPAVIADIRTVDFQRSRLVEVYTEFVNPANFARTLRNPGILCNTHSGGEVILNALNNMPRELNFLSGVEPFPLNIGAGSALPVRLVFVRDPQFEMNKQCKSIAISWVGSDSYLSKGEPIEIPRDAVTVTSVKYHAR